MAPAAHALVVGRVLAGRSPEALAAATAIGVLDGLLWALLGAVVARRLDARSSTHARTLGVVLGALLGLAVTAMAGLHAVLLSDGPPERGVC